MINSFNIITFNLLIVMPFMSDCYFLWQQVIHPHDRFCCSDKFNSVCLILVK